MKTYNYNSHTMFNYLVRTGTLLSVLALSSTLEADQSSDYQPVQTLAQGGVFPVNGLAGDAYGQIVAFNNDFLFVSSPGSQPSNKPIAGAVFVYRWDGAQYAPTQVISTAGTGDHLGMLQILAQGDWLVLGTIGTPIGPQVHDAVTDQDFKGAALIYRLNQTTGQWEWSQTLDSSVPGLANLSSIENGGIPIFETEQGGDFGLLMALDAERGWLFVSALYQKALDGLNQPVMNAGTVYAFRLDPSNGVWQLAQTFTSPDGATENDGFGAAVAVRGRFAMINNGPVFQGPHLGNSSVYVYRSDGGSWSYFQRLTGIQQSVTSLDFPQFSSAHLGVGDSFGNAIALDENDAVMTAPLETTDGGAAFTGAAYFFSAAPSSMGRSAGPSHSGCNRMIRTLWLLELST